MDQKVRLHGDYVANIHKFVEIDDFVDGDNKAVAPYLIPYASETVDDPEARKAWQSRVNRLCHENDCEPILSVHLSHLEQVVNFGALVDNPKMGAILIDATGYEDSGQEVFGQALDGFLRHGRVGVLVEGDAAVAEDRDTAEFTGERSYQIVYSARDILYWAHFHKGPRKGQLREVLLRDQPIDGHHGYVRFFFADGSDMNTEAPFTKQVLQGDKLDMPLKLNGEDITMKVVEQVTGGLSSIPFVLIGKGIEQSILKLPAQYSKGLLNDRSARDNVNYRQGFQKIVMAGVRADQVKYMSEQTVVCISDPAATVTALPPGEVSGLQDVIVAKETKLRRQGMKQVHALVADGSKDVQSAESKGMDNQTLVKFYDKVLNLFQRKLTKIYQLHAEYEGFPGEVTISIPRNYNLEDPAAKRSDRAVVFSQASALGVLSVRQQVLLQGLNEMTSLVPDDNDMTGEDTRKRLMDDVRAAKAPEELGVGPFGNRDPLANL